MTTAQSQRIDRVVRDLRDGALTQHSIARIAAALRDARARSEDARDDVARRVAELTEDLRAEHDCSLPDGSPAAAVYPRIRRRGGVSLVVARRTCRVCGLDSDGAVITDDQGEPVVPVSRDAGAVGVSDVVLYGATTVALVTAVAAVVSCVTSLS